MASLARPAVHHGVDAAGVFLGVAVFPSRRGGGHDAALLLFHVDGGFLDVGGLEGAEVVGGLEAFVPGAAVHVGEGLHVRGGEEEGHALALVDPLLAAGGGVDDVFVALTEEEKPVMRDP